MSKDFSKRYKILSRPISLRSQIRVTIRIKIGIKNDFSFKDCFLIVFEFEYFSQQVTTGEEKKKLKTGKK